MRPLFKLVGEGYQRPFELATVRLLNMGSILMQWDTLTPSDKELIVQRGGALVFEGNRVVYRHDDPGILRFADVDQLVAAACNKPSVPVSNVYNSVDGWHAEKCS